MKTLYPSDGVFVIPSPTSVVKGSPTRMPPSFLRNS